MNLSTSLTKSEIEDFIAKSLDEWEMEYDAINATSYTDQMLNDRLNITVRKQINGQMEKFMIELGLPLPEDINHIHTELAQTARKLVETIRDELVTEIKVSGTAIQFSPYDGGWIECKRCGEKVGLYSLTNPSPNPYEIQGFLQRLSEGDREILKLYMLGALRNYCKCDFGKRNMYAY